jgi:hypothetical protein
METHHPTLIQQFPMDSYCALPFKESYRICHAVFRRDAQTQVHMIVHRVPFQQSYPLLIAQISQYLAYRCSYFPEDYLPTVFWDEYDVILALPSYMRQTFKIVHTLFLLPSKGFPMEGERISIDGTPERLSLSGSHGQRPWV